MEMPRIEAGFQGLGCMAQNQNVLPSGCEA